MQCGNWVWVPRKNGCTSYRQNRPLVLSFASRGRRTDHRSPQMCETGCGHGRRKVSSVSGCYMPETKDSELPQLFEEYKSRVYRIIFRLVGDPAEAEDLTQETFIKAGRGLPNLKDPEKRAPWLYRIASNTALDHVRKRSSKERTDDKALGEAVAASAETPVADSVEQSETVKCVRAYAEGLPPLYRVVLVLHELEGLPLNEVAKATNSSLSATKVRLHRARIKFASLCGAECEHFYNDSSNLCCEPKTNLASSQT